MQSFVPDPIWSRKEFRSSYGFGFLIQDWAELNWSEGIKGRVEMSGGAPGDLVARAFESMLKECSNKKYNDLQSSIQTYLGAFLSPILFTLHSIFDPMP